MKWILLPVFMLLSTFVWCQAFIIEYDQSTNLLNVTYTGCEICLLGTASAVARCECWHPCEEAAQEELDDCIDECFENYTDPSLDLDYCLDGCDAKYHHNRQQCMELCGGWEPEPIRTIVAYQYRLHADWANIPFDPLASPANRESTDWVTIVSPNVVIPAWQIPDPWPDIHSGHNTCYGIEILIQYSDGLVCGGTVWECNIAG